MADKTSNLAGDASIVQRYVDNGDGTWSPATSVGKGNTSGVAAVAALVAAGAGTVNGADLVNPSARGVKVFIDCTVMGGTPTLTVSLQVKDAISGKYVTVLTSAALAAVATTVLTLFPGLTAAANVTGSDVLPRDWRVIYTVGGVTPAVTATISYAYLAS